MRKKVLSVIVINVLVAVISGCVANQYSLADKGLVSVEKKDSEKVEILWTDVYQKDGQTWAYGALKQRGYHTYAVQTHVDIQILSENGSVQYETFSDDIYVPRHRTGKGPDIARFKAKLNGDIPKGSKVTMKVHSGKHDTTVS